MATWQQGINSGGFLAGIGTQNENAPKLSVNMEKAIEKSAGDAAASRNAADSMTTLADTLEKEKPTPGLFGNAENMFSKLTGQDNYLRDMRIRFKQLATLKCLVDF